MGDRVLGREPGPVSPPGPTEDPPRLRPRKRVLWHQWWRAIPQPACAAWERWSIGDHQRASNGGGVAAAARIGQHHLAGAVRVGDMKFTILYIHG